MKYIACFVFVLYTVSVSAQDCSPALLRKLPGSWKAGQQGSVNDVTAADLAREKSTIAHIHAMISGQYKPTGCQVSYSNVFGMSKVAATNWLANPYHYSMYILRFLCNKDNAAKSKYDVDISTPTTVNISANVMYWLNNLYAASLAPDDFRGYLKLTKRPIKKDGYYFMGEEKVDYNSPIYEYRWLITYDDVLPFTYLSRKDYLLIQKKRLEKAVRDSPSEKAFLEPYFKNIRVALTGTEEELNKPAICAWNEEERFEKFVDEGTRGSFIAVVPNPAYYHKNLPLSAPQFFTVVYKISKGDAVFEDNIAAIEKAVDFAALKNMLGK